jgi:hypothetical protein
VGSVDGFICLSVGIFNDKVMHFGKHNPQHTYTMNDYSINQPIYLETTEVERGLGISLSSNGKFFFTVEQF